MSLSASCTGERVRSAAPAPQHCCCRSFAALLLQQPDMHAHTSVLPAPPQRNPVHLVVPSPPAILHAHTSILPRGTPLILPATHAPNTVTHPPTCTLWFLLHLCSSLPSTSNMKMHLSGPADRKRRLSGIQQQHVTASLCCVKALSSWPEEVAHSRSLPSSLQEAGRGGWC